MRKSGLPIIPGSTSIVKSKEEAIKTAHRIKYPVIIKAAAGGGGRGMRICHNDISLINSLMTAQTEAETAFGNASVYIEKYIPLARHIEFQILADNYGHIIHLGERDCSIQRKHQKLLEEAPCSSLDSKLRKKIGEMAIRGAKAVNYRSVGTIEFLLDKEGNFYFMEMNTRIQVEHPVTEMTTGIDLIKEQIKLAAGEKLKISQDDVKVKGVALECRINAEDPDNGFMPCPGQIQQLYLPGGFGIRVDTHIFNGYRISPYYDSLIAKVISHGKDRNEAIRIMRRALEEFIVYPIKTTIPLHKKILQHPLYLRGEISTNFLEDIIQEKEGG
jgi:acetyl-CoA carboxylase biotin carboxylase subunit